VIAALALSLTGVAALGCSDAEPVHPPDAAPPDAVPIGNVTRFGFAAVECGWDDPHDTSTKSTYGDETEGFTNMAHLCVFSEADDIRARVDGLRARGQQALVHIELVLFARVPGSSPRGNGERLVLRADADAAWAAFVAANGAALTPANIAALYVVDEPTWNGLTPADLTAALAIVDRTHGSLATVAIEGYPSLAQWQVPPALDLLGFDRFYTYDPRRDPDWQADLRTLRTLRTRADQRFWIIMDTQWLPFYGDVGVTPAMMSDVAYHYLEVAAAEPDVVAIAGFLWPGGLDEPDQLGARDLPASVQDAYHRIGRAIIAPR
jgi:hypothetical protein